MGKNKLQIFRQKFAIIQNGSNVPGHNEISEFVILWKNYMLSSNPLDFKDLHALNLTSLFFFVAGKRCEYLTSLSFLHNTSYVEFEPLTVHPKANVTIKFATDQENGVLLYSGESQHLAVELFRGRLR